MKKIFFILSLGLLTSPFLLSAQSTEPPAPVTTPGQLLNVLNWLLGFVWVAMGMLVVLMLLYAGFQFVTAAGDTDKIDKAKTMVKYSLVGIVVMVLAGGVITLVENIFGEAV